MKVYFDTNLYISYFKSGNENSVVSRLFNRCLGCEFKMVFSDWTAYELQKYIDPEYIRMWFEVFKSKDKIVKICKTDEDIEEAKKRQGHYHDTLHAILAKKVGADVLLTRNMRDFKCCQDLIEAKLPEDF